ncbi:MAG: PBECR2 nuclease fold domain-containing protein [Verrucomicrobiales bacterium]
MILPRARPFAEALESREAKSILPTKLRTKDLARLSPAVRERAMFSAAVTDVRFLEETSGLIDGLLRGETYLASARLKLDQYLDSVGYDGELFSPDLTDLRGLARKNVLLETNVGLALGYGQWKQGQDPVELNLWPAQELIRVENRREPRQDWRERFLAAGGTEWNGVLIALTNSPVWSTLSRFGYPYPPFDFQSGMGVRARRRADAIAAGLMSEEDDMIPETRGLDEETKLSLPIRQANLRRAIAEQLAGIAEFDGDDLVKLAPDFSQSAASLRLPEILALRAPRPDPGRVDPAHAIARLQAGVEVEDVTGRTVRLDVETMTHWKFKEDELARAGFLARAEDTLANPLEVWDQGTQRVFVNTYENEIGLVKGFMLFVRPSGVVDNFFTSKLKQLEKNRRGKERLYGVE